MCVCVCAYTILLEKYPIFCENLVDFNEATFTLNREFFSRLTIASVASIASSI